MKRTLLAILLLCGLTFGQEERPILYDHESGVNLGMSLIGGGIGIGYRKYINRIYSFSGTLSLVWVRDPKEFSYIDYYGYARKINGNNTVILVPLQFDFRRRLFTEDIDESFQPFVNLGAGIVPGMNFPQKGSDETALTGMIFTGAGFTMVSSDALAITISLQLQGTVFPKKFGGRKDYSTLLLQATFAKLKRK
jgi:hypothetical protein